MQQSMPLSIDRPRIGFVGSALTLALCMLCATSASAQDGKQLLKDAEDAYLNVDFEESRKLSLSALEYGGNSVKQLVRIYELIGIAAAAEGDEEASRDAYIKMLALSPDAEVDESIAPQLRSPFMEAKGYWSSKSEGLSVRTRYVGNQNKLRATLTDPLGMGSELVLHFRPEGDGSEYTEARVASDEDKLMFEVGEGPVEYYLELVDEYDNSLYSVGTEFEPEVAGNKAAETGGLDLGLRKPEKKVSIFKKPWFWIMTGVVLAGAAFAVYYFGLREKPIQLAPSITFGQL